MNSTENMEKRLEYVKMHDYFKNKIENAMEKQQYIEACWLIYSALENRYFRTLQKFKDKCKYCKGKSKCVNNKKNELAIATKIGCVERLYKANVSCIKESFAEELFTDTKKWIKKRNDLMHELLSLDEYKKSDIAFKECAECGVFLLNKTYTSCTNFRKLFYSEGYEFVFPKTAMDGCPCNPKKGSKK